MSAPEPLFLDGRAGRLFLMHYRVAGAAPDAGALLVLPAFAEEMNKSRRQLALLGRALAAQGTPVLIPDLSGTGDSASDLADASVTLWLDDLARTIEFARALGYPAPRLLAVRAGALLVAPLLRECGADIQHAVLWQPQTSGQLMINQFLRLRVAAGLTGASDGLSVKDLRAQLAAGNTVEVAGYALNPTLVEELDRLTLAQLADSPLRRVDWLTLGREQASPPPATTRTLDALGNAGIDARFAVVPGDPFWATAEIATVPALNDATCEALR